MQNTCDRFGARLKEARERAHLTQEEVARRAQIRRVPSVSDYERGAKLPSLPLAARLAQALGVSLDDLVAA